MWSRSPITFRRLILRSFFAGLVWSQSTGRVAHAQPTEQSRLIVHLPTNLPASLDAAGGFEGRLFVFISARENREPRRGPDWFRPEPFFAIDVHQFRPGETRTIDSKADAFPNSLSQLPAGTYRAQAVLDHDLDHHQAGTAPGNLFSPVTTFECTAGATLRVELILSEIVPPARPFPTTRWQHEGLVKSALLSKFHQREIVIPASVILPASYYDRPAARYPVIYSIPGFGGSYRSGLSDHEEGRQPGADEVDFIRVQLTGECKWGHHAFANSATNGPWGDALVRELIPHIDATFRTVPQPTARFVTGHSSGGWASLWQQIAYPEIWGGVWSTAPDPVDFRDFQLINIYAPPPTSVYVDEHGNRRPIARGSKDAALYFDNFCKMDDVLKRGGQLRSFEAVFSPRGADASPLKLWDRPTGLIDPSVARAWESYDIRLKLEREWTRLQPQLAGKIHIWVGSLDTFYLDGAVKLLQDSLARLGSDAEVVIVPDRNHSNLAGGLRSTILREMSQSFLAHRPSAGP